MVTNRPFCRGSAALPTAVVLALVLLLVLLSTQRNVLVELRNAADRQRASQAFEAAEAGLAWTLARLADPRPVDASCLPAAAGPTFRARYASAAGLAGNAGPACVRDAGAWRCACPAEGDPSPAIEGNADAAFQVRLTATDRTDVLGIVATGCASHHSDCSQAAATARNEMLAAWLPALVRLPAAALTVRGAIDGSGAVFGAHHASVESGGLALHAGGTIGADAARITPPAGSLRSDAVAASDATLAARSDTDFFAHWFGMPATALAARAQRIRCPAGDCAAALLEALATTHAQLLLVDGELAIDSPVEFGTPQRPVALVATGAARIGADLALHGLLHAASLDWHAGTGPAARVHGAVVVNGDARITAGVDFAYDAALLRRLATQAATPVTVPGSWRDF